MRAMANKVTSQMRVTCLQAAASSADRESPTDVVSRALVYEQYLSGEVAERMAVATAVTDQLAEIEAEAEEIEDPEDS